MAWLKGSRKKRLVLDIGSSAIRLCELSQTKAGYQLTRYYQRETLIDPTLEEDEKGRIRIETLEKLLKEAKIRTRKTILAVPGQSVFTRNRPLPPVPEYKVTQIVRYEIQQQIPFSLDQIALDYQVLDRTEAGGYDVMMAAIKVDVVEKPLQILEKVKRSIDIVDVCPLAAYNWLKHTGEFGDSADCVALLDLGASTTDIVIQKDNQFRFTRSLNIGGNDVTSAIAAGFNLKFEEAEKLKRERAFAPTGNPEKDGKGGEIVGRVLGRLVAEIKRSFAYYRSQPGGAQVTRVIVTGGGACLRNIIPYLQRQLGIEIRIAQPLAGLAIAPAAAEASEHPEQACVVLGLALRCCQPVPIQINLIPPRITEAARRKEQAFYWALSFVTLFLILASIIPATAAKDELVQQRNQTLRQVLASYDPALVAAPDTRSPFEDEFSIIKNDVQADQRDVDALDSLRQRQTFWLEYWKEINDIRPPGGVVISSFEAAIIGGPENTGEAWRNRQNGGPPGAAPAAPVPAAPPADTGGFLGNLGGFAGLANVPGVAGDTKVYQARGFAGIGPKLTGGGSGFGLAGGMTPAQPQEPTIEEPNGLILYGYAESLAQVEQFWRDLRKSKKFVEAYLHVDMANEVPLAELDQPQVGGKDTGATAVPTSGGGGGLADIGEAGGLGALSALESQVGISPVQTPGGAGADFGPKVTRFRIDVQFLGDPLPQPGEKA